MSERSDVAGDMDAQRYAPDFDGHMLPAEDGHWVKYVQPKDRPFVVRQFEGAPWVPLHEAARLHDAAQEASVTIAGLRNALALAVAHDRQPYPTAWAYEQACRVRDELRAAIRQWGEAEDAMAIALLHIDDPDDDGGYGRAIELQARAALALRAALSPVSPKEQA